MNRPLGYLGMWRAVPASLLFFVVTLVTASVGFTLVVALFSAAAGTLITLVLGLAFLIGCFYVARAFGTIELVLLDLTGRAPIERPLWNAPHQPGFFGWLWGTLRNGHNWLYTLFVGLVGFVMTIITSTIAVTWVATAVGGLTQWFWLLVSPRGDDDLLFGDWVFWMLDLDFDVDSRFFDGLVMFVIGLLFTAALPPVLHFLVFLRHSVASALLGRWQSERLAVEVATLEDSRGAAVSAEGQSLRRLERDIHDGPQQRLVRMQMDLAAAERQLDMNPDAARELVENAMQQSREALEELRALSRGFAPPILLDRGLVAAVESAASRSTVPTTVLNELSPALVLSDEVERSAYFVASEALANIAKHSEATAATVRMAVVESASGASLTLVVSDDGIGGAQPRPGHGLAGLAERLRGVGGTLATESPDGGPTVVTAVLPL